MHASAGAHRAPQLPRLIAYARNQPSASQFAIAGDAEIRRQLRAGLFVQAQTDGGGSLQLLTAHRTADGEVALSAQNVEDGQTILDARSTPVELVDLDSAVARLIQHVDDASSTT
ncbi:hypothetical protein [Pseudoclavibacter helvolus]|uniref:hypothetical protein n=1 Tax=Pseudoclavibacter helvolus TaxID=255205 RepID=UPI0024AD3F3D|nr:hypothetical protein [Pseudoclavibacter helvolus]